MSGPAEPTQRIAMWSGPRSGSTALMRAWENRADTEVWDEPFYACYLAATGLPHPMAETIIEVGETDWARVSARCLGSIPSPHTVWYQKHMAQHMLSPLDPGWIRGLQHAFLIRDPRSIVASYARTRAQPTVEDVGVVRLARIFDQVRSVWGRIPPVIDNADLLARPQQTLGLLCEALSIPFDPDMLSWPPGPRSSDGIWAPHWYHGVYRSTRFEHRPSSLPRLSDAHEAVVSATTPHYARLWAHRLGA